MPYMSIFLNMLLLSQVLITAAYIASTGIAADPLQSLNVSDSDSIDLRYSLHNRLIYFRS